MNEELELVFPTEQYLNEIKEYVREFYNYGEKSISGGAGLDRFDNLNEWLIKVNEDLDLKKSEERGRVQSAFYLTIRKSDNKIVGNIQIRYRLNETLLKVGGHIGDSVRPSERKKGYATKQISLALLKCKELGIGNVLMTCKKENIASAKSILNNGGILENEVEVNGIIEQRYWISLKKRYAKRYLDKYADKITYKKINVKDEYFEGDIVYYKFDKASRKAITPNGTIIIDDNYEIIEFYNYNSRIKLTAFYNDKRENIEWYFDIARKIGIDNDNPYEDDLYLDVVVEKDFTINLVDEDELLEAFNRLEVSKEMYDIAYNEAYWLMDKLKGNVKLLKEYTDNYLKRF